MHIGIVSISIGKGCEKNWMFIMNETLKDDKVKLSKEVDTSKIILSSLKFWHDTMNWPLVVFFHHVGPRVSSSPIPISCNYITTTNQP
jgi:hypothetical protein